MKDLRKILLILTVATAAVHLIIEYKKLRQLNY
jgi:hypothetical protein